MRRDRFWLMRKRAVQPSSKPMQIEPTASYSEFPVTCEIPVDTPAQNHKLA